MVTKITSLTQYNQITSSGNVLAIGFTASWCSKCKNTLSLLSSLEGKFTKAQFYTVDIGDNPDIGQQATIRTLPTILVFKGGQLVGSVPGANPTRVEFLLTESLSKRVNRRTRKL
ncbi:thioredoxin-like protein [Lactarius quietus]|nr:thioredoxin-like protein [Lactarius quietus]